MLKSLELDHLGPSDKLHFDFAPRLNVITGDNGLGKSFILEVAWWALTRTWADLPAWPRREHLADARIRATIKGSSNKPSTLDSHFNGIEWASKGVGRPTNPGLVLYARVNGGFSVWDPVRNYWKKAPSLGIEQPNRPDAFLFKPHNVWEGLHRGATLNEEAATRLKSTVFCRGLIEDWVTWQTGSTEADQRAFAQLESVLREFSFDPDHPLEPGEPMQLPFTNDERRMPTVVMPYGDAVPAHYVAAGVRRIMALAYLLVWAWQAHVRACSEVQRPLTNRIVVLVDEIEAHLHPRWQRRILRALLKVVEQLDSKPKVQVLAATHSPLVLASLEPLFDEKQDRLWLYELAGGKVSAHAETFYPKGDANGWLTSDVFDLQVPGSVEAETALLRAKALLVADAPDPAAIAEVDALLKAALSSTDRFWVRWSAWRDTHLGRGARA
ncbi:MAG: ATP-binding protein [Myxococcales bacterium]|nr:ATP-binding protein [Myxococcales bacterium]MCB9550901.1 ATP-binding protein [Myxococcales bacterium]